MKNFILAIAAVVALSAGAFTSTASAHGGGYAYGGYNHGYSNHGHCHTYYRPTYNYGYTPSYSYPSYNYGGCHNYNYGGCHSNW